MPPDEPHDMAFIDMDRFAYGKVLFIESCIRPGSRIVKFRVRDSVLLG